jgi:hypothetical protein
MLNMKALITTLVLGSSSVAVAGPSVSFTAHAQASWGTTSAGPLVRDHRYGDEGRFDDLRRRRAGTWIALSEPVSAARRNVIRLGERRDDISKLRLQTTRGSTYIYALNIRFDDGSRQVLTVNKWLYSGMPSLELDLPRNRRGIDRIIVTSYAGRGAMYQLFGLQTRHAELPPVYQPPVPPIFQPPGQPPVYQPPVYQPPVSHGLIVGRDLTFANTTGYKYVVVGAEKGRFSTLRIQATSGGFPITYIQVDFTDGTAQVMNPNRLVRSGEIADFQLDGNGTHGIRQIIIKTNNNHMPVHDQSTFDVVVL